ncbi:hypothetical protein G6F42_028647 [Rhizopus arrhizus]|nr:hypothetical protein G6F42_028647 [Rhizopus arrhizus]
MSIRCLVHDVSIKAYLDAVCSAWLLLVVVAMALVVPSSSLLELLPSSVVAVAVGAGVAASLLVPTDSLSVIVANSELVT